MHAVINYYNAYLILVLYIVGHAVQAGRSPVRVPDEVDFFNLPNPSVALWPYGRLSL
jgi:hypothetical protein